MTAAPTNGYGRAGFWVSVASVGFVVVGAIIWVGGNGLAAVCPVVWVTSAEWAHGFSPFMVGAGLDAQRNDLQLPA